MLQIATGFKLALPQNCCLQLAGVTRRDAGAEVAEGFEEELESEAVANTCLVALVHRTA
jgi:hypothetical protein